MSSPGAAPGSQSTADPRQAPHLAQAFTASGNSEHPKGLTMRLGSVAGWCCTSIPGWHCTFQAFICWFACKPLLHLPGWTGQPPLNGGPGPSSSAFSLGHSHAQVWQAMEVSAEPPPGTCLRATSLAVTHGPEDYMPSTPRQPWGWKAQTLLLTEPRCISSSSPADSAWCREAAAEAQCSLHLSKGHKHWETEAAGRTGFQQGQGSPPHSSHMVSWQGCSCWRGTGVQNQPGGSLPALALLVLSELHLHVGSLPIRLYLQELKEEQRLLPRQQQKGAGRAPTALPRHRSLLGRRMPNLFPGASGSRGSTSTRRQHRPGPATPAAWEALLVSPCVFRAVI